MGGRGAQDDKLRNSFSEEDNRPVPDAGGKEAHDTDCLSVAGEISFYCSTGGVAKRVIFVHLAPMVLINCFP